MEKDLVPVQGPRRRNGQRRTPMAPVRVLRPHGVGELVPADNNLDEIRALQAASKAPSTIRAYESDFKEFELWCAQRNVASLPCDPMTLASYLTAASALVDEHDSEFYAPSTLAKWIAAINFRHEINGFAKPGNDPEVTATMLGIKRTAKHETNQKAPLLLNDLKRTLNAVELNAWQGGSIGHRDWALMLIGFVGAYRRSELASLVIKDVELHTEDGIHITLRRSKTDQEGKGLKKALPYGDNPVTCAPCAYVRWMRVVAAAKVGRPEVMRVLRQASAAKHVCREPFPAISEQDSLRTLFRPVLKNGTIVDRPISGNVVNDVVRRRVAAIGMNHLVYGAHSLRAGFVTQAFRAGATHHEVMRQTGHKSVAMVEIYSRENNPLLHNAVTRLGL